MKNEDVMINVNKNIIYIKRNINRNSLINKSEFKTFENLFAEKPFFTSHRIQNNLDYLFT